MNRSRTAALLLAAMTIHTASAQDAAPPAIPPAPAAPPAAPVAADLPAAADLFENYIRAIGGMDAIKRHTSIKYMGTVRIADMNYSAFLTVWQAAPRSLVMHVEPPGGARAMQFCDGSRSWGYDAPPAGPGWRFFEGSQHADILFSSDFYGDADYKQRYEVIETRERTDFNGRPAFKVYVKCADSREQFLFFDAETALIIGTHTIHDEGGRLTPLIIVNGEYKEVDGVKYVSGQTHRTPGRDVVFTYRVIEPNPKDMPAIEIPDELKGSAPSPAPKPAPAPAPDPK